MTTSKEEEETLNEKIVTICLLLFSDALFKTKKSVNKNNNPTLYTLLLHILVDLNQLSDQMLKRKIEHTYQCATISCSNWKKVKKKMFT